jgi:hypothetical protein
MAYGTVNADVIGTSVVGSNLGAGNATLLKNRLIDAGFIINQRGYVSGTALSTGTYAHDRWKAGASGCTYTFTQGSLGVPIVITITAGSLQQIIEGCNMPDGGTFTLSWTGTAQGRVNGGGYSTSPLIVTGLTAGANCTVEFNIGTCSFPQLEVGSSATGFEYRQYGQELALCQRYYQIGDYHQVAAGTSSGDGTITLPIQMRTSPSMAYTDYVGAANKYSDSGGNGLTYSIDATSFTAYRIRPQTALARNCAWWGYNYTLSAEL